MRRRVCRVTVSATDVVAPVLTAAKVVVLFPAGVTAQTCLGDLFRRLVLEGDDLLRIAFFSVCLAWTMTGFAARHLLFPTPQPRELSMRSVRKEFELVFVAVFASLAAGIVFRLVRRDFGLRRVRRTVGTEPTRGQRYEGTDQDCFGDFKHRAFLEFLFD